MRLQVHVHICVQNVYQTRGVQGHAPSGNFVDVIWWNLGLYSHKHNLPFIVIKALIKARMNKIEFSAYPREASQRRGGGTNTYPPLLKETLLL